MDIEKINIYVPDSIAKMLESDAILFEIFKKDGHTINKNRFLSMLILGYYEEYIKESKVMYDSVLDVINSEKISQKEKEKIADAVLNKVLLPKVPSRKGKNPKRLSLKPTKDTEFLISMIMDELGGNDYISQYFCRMLMSYCEKPLSKREQIIFKKNYECIKDACDKQIPLKFSTIWNTGTFHEIIPYRIAIGPEEIYNYILCQEINELTGKKEARSYRLNRIAHISYGKSNEKLDMKVEDHLNQMLEYGPQYAINDDEEICVKLTKNGSKLFNRIYYGRPKPKREEINGSNTFLYFDCSKDQIYFYFRRFNGAEAEVISPLWLREKIIDFHKKSLDAYK